MYIFRSDCGTISTEQLILQLVKDMQSYKTNDTATYDFLKERVKELTKDF